MSLRRPRALVAVTCALVAAALVAWSALGGSPSAGRARGPAARARAASLPPAERPRTRLDRRNEASGPAVGAVDIPAIGVHARLVELGLTPAHALQVPSRASQAGVWAGGAAEDPGRPTVIAGHVDSQRGPAVFFRLRALRRGDDVAVRRPGRGTAHYVVVGSESVSKDAFPTARVYGLTRAGALRLVTCDGSFNQASGHYRDNLIVYARRA
jgi:sortase (surface protein transpeptidase)